MITSILTIAYALIGVYRGFTKEPMWWELLGCPMWEYRREPDRDISTIFSFCFSGLLWPIEPVAVAACKERQRQLERYQRRRDREKELEEAEKELDL